MHVQSKYGWTIIWFDFALVGGQFPCSNASKCLPPEIIQLSATYIPEITVGNGRQQFIREVKGVRNSRYSISISMLHSLVIVVRGMSSVAKSLVVFVLGGPGAGKGTQCERIVKVRCMVKYLGRPPPVSS